MRRKTKYIITIVILVAIILALVGGYWCLQQRGDINATSNDDEISKSATQESIDALSQAHGTGNILAVTDNKITNIDLENSQQSEQDSSVKSYSTAVSSDGSIIVLDQKDNLKIWKTDGKEKEIVSANNYNPLPVISPDGKHMLVIAFSNAERDFGYKLQIFTTDNEYVRDSASSQSKISSPLWGSDSTVYFASISENGSILYKTDTDGSGDKEEILDIDDLFVIDMACAGDMVYFTASSGKNDSNNTNIYKIIDGKEIAITTESGIYSDLQTSPDGVWIAYIDGDSILTIRNGETGASYQIQKVGHLLGWF